MLSLFEIYSGGGTSCRGVLFSYIVLENIAAVQKYLQSVSDQVRQLSLSSLILLAVLALVMFITIEKTLNESWRVSEP